MKEAVATVPPDADNPAHLRPTEAGGPRASSQPAAKFTYSSGAQPLPGYVIKRGVGHGGFGEVYYATSEAGKEVALKLVRRNLEIELRGIRQCLNLKHPNLLSIHDIRRDGQDDCWVIMEYMSGEPLQDILASHPNGLPEEDVLAWLHGIAAGVGYLHDHGIVHRDLKPGNLFCDEGVIKIGDYGLSKFISCSRRSGQTESVGTVHYMAPEVANGRYGKEIDIYALGIILYEMLTGRVPFEGESVGEVLMKHLTAQPDVSMLPEPYRTVVARALEKDPAKRFKSVAEMVAMLPPASGAAGWKPAPLAGPSGAAGWRPAPLAEAAPVVEVVEEEPVLRAVRHFCSRMSAAWNESNLNTPTKVVLIVVGAFALLATANVLVPLSVTLLAAYAVYRLVRLLVVGRHGGAAGAQAAPLRAGAPPVRGECAAPPATPRHGGPAGPRWVHPREEAANALVCKPKIERAAELAGSLLVAALAAAIMCVVVIVLNSFRTDRAYPAPEQCAWLALMSIAGAWAVLIVSKSWEGVQGEAVVRRFVLLVVGLGLGVLGYGVSNGLLVELATIESFPKPPHNYQLPASFYGPGGEPLLMAFLACFGALFALVRWWRQADPLRPTRLSLWSVLVCVLAAALVAAVCRFPQPWLPMTAGAMSVAVQIASPWRHPRRRYAPHHG